MKTTTITKLDFIMLCLCTFPLFTLTCSTLQIPLTGITQYIISFLNLFCIGVPLLYSAYRMINGYKNIASLFTLWLSMLCTITLCASLCGVIVPYI